MSFLHCQLVQLSIDFYYSRFLCTRDFFFFLFTLNLEYLIPYALLYLSFLTVLLAGQGAERHVLPPCCQLFSLYHQAKSCTVSERRPQCALKKLGCRTRAKYLKKKCLFFFNWQKSHHHSLLMTVYHCLPNVSPIILCLACVFLSF